jgi:hypothetical protein
MIRLSLILLITLINIVVAVLPAIMIFGFLYYGKVAGMMLALKYVVLGILLVYSGYLLLDFVLGINMKIVQMIRRSYRFGGKYQKKLELPLELIRKKYGMPHLKLFISDAEKVENYAMASVLEKYVCLSVGMVNALEIRAKSPEEFQILSCVVLAKQAYNLRSGNYLPDMLWRNNERVVHFVEKCFGGLFKGLCFVIKYIPVIGVIISDGLNFVHKTIAFVLKIVNKILIKLYQFVSLMAEIYVQQKGDWWAAKVIGGKYVAHALGVTEEENIKMFSFKPRLRHRIANVKNIERTTDGVKIYPVYQVLYGIVVLGIFCAAFVLARGLL